MSVISKRFSNFALLVMVVFGTSFSALAMTSSNCCPGDCCGQACCKSAHK